MFIWSVSIERQNLPYNKKSVTQMCYMWTTFKRSVMLDVRVNASDGLYCKETKNLVVIYYFLFWRRVLNVEGCGCVFLCGTRCIQGSYV
jgi:hypothetical protein